MALLAVDIGGSGSRAVLSGDPDQYASGPPLKLSSGRADVGQAIHGLAASLPPAPLDVVAVGMASLVTFGDPFQLAGEFRAQWPARRLVLASDAVTALLAVWGRAGGAVVAAGTGVVGLGTDFASTWVRVDGWGPQLGDDGGGAWIGRRGLRAALRAFDGRPGGSPALLSEVERRYGDPARLPALVNSAPAAFLADFAPVVLAVVGDGDPVAADIVREAGRQLARTGVAALRGGVPQRLALVGGLARQPLAAAFLDELRRLGTAAEISVGRGVPLDGARLLAELAADDPSFPTPHPPYLHVFDHA